MALGIILEGLVSTLLRIQPKVRFPLVRIGPMAFITAVRQDGTYVVIVVYDLGQLLAVCAHAFVAEQKESSGGNAKDQGEEEKRKAATCQVGLFIQTIY
jgi:hypothetical protein